MVAQQGDHRGGTGIGAGFADRRLAQGGAKKLGDAVAARLSKICLRTDDFFAAGADRVVSDQAIEDFAVDLKVGGHILMPGSRHEILQETDSIRQQFWAAFDAYMGVDIPSSAQA